jgi:2-polyprenyl-6-methoxyphenol hydroxylase-like FAD-dependent oxidoreductase
MSRALIIGGSVGGLFAANLLRGIGWDVVVFEGSNGDLADRGRNIGATEDLFAVMRQAGVHADASLGVAWRSRLCLDRGGRVECEVLLPGLTTLWSSIHRPLKASLPPQLYCPGIRLERVEQDASSVTAIFVNGSRITGDLLIGADGIRSTVRRQFVPEVEPRYCGYISWHVTLDGRDIPHDFRELLLDHMTFSFPDGEWVLSIPMPGPDGRTDPDSRRCQFAWFRAADYETMLPQLCTDIHGRRHNGAVPPPLIQPRFISELKVRATALLPAQIAGLFERAPQPRFHPSFSDVASPRMVFGRVVLLGDAAFVARPHVATGVTKAALDAKCLADALAASNGDLDTALVGYQCERQQAGDLLVARGRRLGGHVETQLKLHQTGETRPDRWHETVMREYGAAGVMNENALAVHAVT